MILSFLSKIYGNAIRFRNHLYDIRYWKSLEFTVPLISIGNLRVGGTGKTPHIEYLIRQLEGQYRVATLSRGYRRRSKGYLLANDESTAQNIGDEPMQLYRKFGHQIAVVVCEERAVGIVNLLVDRPDVQVILLDDAYQHRAVLPHLSILLTQYHQPFTRDQLLPKGRLREPADQKKRADIIMITQCPATLTTADKQAMHTEIQPLPHQQLLFSHLRYEKAYHWQNPQHNLPDSLQNHHLLLLCAIAQPETLQQHLQNQCQQLTTLSFSDHHTFTQQDIDSLVQIFEQIPTDSKIIITTEKDAVRLQPYHQQLQNIPIFVLPIAVYLDPQDEAILLQKIHTTLSNKP